MAESEILVRLTVGLVLVVLTVFAVITGGILLLVLLQIAICLGAWEVLRMGNVDGRLNRFLAISAAASIAFGFFAGHPLEVVVITLLSAMTIQLAGRGRATADSMGRLLLAVLYPSLFLSHVLLLREISVSHATFPLVCVWTFDTAAYLVGRAFGRTRLAPTISPGKSLEGTAGGIICAAVAAVLAKFTFADFLSLHAAVFLAIVLALLGQAGDLFESWMKRNADIKDSSGALPGHGGVMDRLDSLTFAIPAGYYLLMWITPS